LRHRVLAPDPSRSALLPRAEHALTLSPNGWGLTLTATGCPPNTTAVFFMGATTFSPAFVGDGLMCTGGAGRFFPVGVNSSGTVRLPSPYAYAPPGSIAAGDTRHFQVWTRDDKCGPPPAPCVTPCGRMSNISNAYTVTFEP
jgi:hypothetical protein